MFHSNSPLTTPAAILCIAASLILPSAARADCVARSGAKTAALIELYTSEGCSSCPPADRRLSDLRGALNAGAVAVPLALHVDYWDYIGWKDPFAQKSFAKRQNWLAHLSPNRNGFVYTPQFFVAGAELRSWSTDLGEEVRRLNARTPLADIALEAKLIQGDTLAVHVQTEMRKPVPGAAVYLALTESRLTSKVTRGENGGATLSHDHVVREWLGPYAVTERSAIAARNIVLQAQWNRTQLSLVAFVQDPRDGSVLQAVHAPGCALPS